MKKKKLKRLVTLMLCGMLSVNVVPAHATELSQAEENEGVEIQDMSEEEKDIESQETIEEENAVENQETIEQDNDGENQEAEEQKNNTESQEVVESQENEAVTTKNQESSRIAAPASVTNLKAQVVNWNQVKLTWTKSNAEGYIIYRKKASESTFSYCYMTGNDNFVDTKAERGNYNFYRVYPYVTNESGKRVLGTSTTYVYAKPGEGPVAVSGLKASLQYSNYVNLTWNASAEAEGYIIYRKTQYDDKFEYRYMVKGTSFVDKDAMQASYNYYRVYPYYTNEAGKRCIGESKTYVYAKPIGAPEVYDLQLSVSPYDGSISLGWSYQYNFTDLDGFIVYRKVGSNDTFKYLDTVKGENGWIYSFYNDTKASMTDYNFYKVYPYSIDENGKKRIGPCANYVYGKASLPAVRDLSTFEQMNQVRIRWERSSLSKEEGYYIYRKQGDGKFEYLASTKGTEYIDTKASKTTVNYYRVYPYRTINGKKATGLSDTYVYGRAKNYSQGQEIADYGWQFIGTPYVWGGNDLRTGVDCSGFTSQVYLHFGIYLPRVAADQATHGVDVGRDLANAQPGDIICYCYNLSEEACHAAIYVGNGRIIHSTTTYLRDGSKIDGIQIGYANYMTIKSIRRYY